MLCLNKLSTIEMLSLAEELLGPGKKENYKGTEYKFICPECSDNSIHMNIEHGGIFWCHSCSLKGNLVTLGRLLGKIISPGNTIPSREPEKIIDWDLLEKIYTEGIYQSSIIESHAGWLLARGIEFQYFRSSDSVYKTLRTKFSPEELEEAGLLRKDIKKKWEPSPILWPDRIVIPYFKYDGSCIHYIRSRGVKIKDNGIKYLSPSGVPQKETIYGFNEVPQNSNYIIVTEGEFKSRAVLQLGLIAVGLPGMGSNHIDLATLCRKRGVRAAYICFDSSRNSKKQESADRQSIQLAWHLRREGIMSCPVHLPLLREYKMDLDRYILLNGTKAEKELRELLGKSMEDQRMSQRI